MTGAAALAQPADADVEPAVLTVTARDFTWRRSTGFSYRPGSDETIGLNRTREGALARIATHQTFCDMRRRAFLATLFDEYEMATIVGSSVTFENGEHVVRGRRFHIKAADIGA